MRDRRGREAPVVLVEVDLADHPELRGVAQGLVRPGDVEIAGAARRNVDVLQGEQGHPDQEFELLPGRADEGVDPHIRRNVVRQGGGAGKDQDRRDDRRGDKRRPAQDTEPCIRPHGQPSPARGAAGRGATCVFLY